MLAITSRSINKHGHKAVTDQSDWPIRVLYKTSLLACLQKKNTNNSKQKMLAPRLHQVRHQKAGAKSNNTFRSSDELVKAVMVIMLFIVGGITITNHLKIELPFWFLFNFLDVVVIVSFMNSLETRNKTNFSSSCQWPICTWFSWSTGV